MRAGWAGEQDAPAAIEVSEWHGSHDEGTVDAVIFVSCGFLLNRAVVFDAQWVKTARRMHAGNGANFAGPVMRGIMDSGLNFVSSRNRVLLLLHKMTALIWVIEKSISGLKERRGCQYC
ncbi:hypothetical protein [Prosthecobacter sp.]|uniref:hypothetical protein n=1 Tax=Prosthecobacter sp. TaxID=1965333 RepID=UPI0024875A90|nr:hypothetical protein [Prosthecobacter sp.]MDI1311676.1 hypothetical protein [Prosthecobacter sp.]